MIDFFAKHWRFLTISLFLLLFILNDQAEASGPKTLIINNQNCGQVSTMSTDANEVRIQTVGELQCEDTPPTPEPEPQPPNVTIVDPGAGMTFLPNCVNGKHWQSTNCEFTGSVVANQDFAIRVDNTNGSTTSFQYVSVTGSETGDDRVTYEIALSVTPGDFDVPPRCKSTSKVTTVYEGAGNQNGCQVPLSRVYVNVRVSDPQCGRQKTCRPKIFGTFIY